MAFEKYKPRGLFSEFYGITFKLGKFPTFKAFPKSYYLALFEEGFFLICS